MKLYLLRHGETVWNQERRLQGRTNIPLSREGCRQVKAAGEYLASSHTPIDVILTSPLDRAVNSAKIIAGQIHYPEDRILTDPLFTERKFGAAEGMTYEEAIAAYPDGYYPGMELLEDLCRRAGAAVAFCLEQYPGRNLLAVAHGGIIKAILTQISNGNISYHDKDIWIDNAALCELEYTDGQWKLSIRNPASQYHATVWPLSAQPLSAKPEKNSQGPSFY